MTPKQAIVVAPIASILLIVVSGAYCLNADVIDDSVALYATGWMYRLVWVLLYFVLMDLALVSATVLVRDVVRWDRE